MHTKKWKSKSELAKIQPRIDKNTKNINPKLQQLAYVKAKELGYNPLPGDQVVNALRKDSEKWFQGLTDEEKRAITKYTYNGVDKDGKRLFEKINGYLMGSYFPDKNGLNVLETNILSIESGILKNKLERDIIVYRTDSNPANLEGRINKFLSTSVTQKGAFKGKPNVAIIVPKGSEGAYVENLSQLKKQREFLFNKGLYLKRIISENGVTIYEVVRK